MMKKIILSALIIALSISVFAQTSEPKLDLIDLIKNLDWINIALVLVLSIGGVIGRYAFKARTKIKQVGELLILLYEYTDDKVLDKKERADIWSRIQIIIGKKKAEQTHEEVKTKQPSSFLKGKRHR